MPGVTWEWSIFGIIGGSVIGITLLHVILYLIFWAIAKRTEWKGDDDLVRLTRFPMLALMNFATLLLVSPFAKPVLSDTIYDKSRHAVSILLILSVGWLAVRLLRFGEIQLLRKNTINLNETLDQNKKNMSTRVTPVKRLLVLLVWIIILAGIIMTFQRGWEIGMGLLTTAGVASLVVGFALAPVFENMISSLQIAISQPVCIGDIVIVDKEWGKVEEITSTYVVVLTWDQRRLIVPLTRFTKQSFENWTRKSPELLGTVFLYVDYQAPLEKMREELQEIVKSSSLWDKRVCALQVTNCDNKTMEVRCLVSAAKASDAFDLRCLVREKMITFLRDHHPKSLPCTRVVAKMKNKEKSKPLERAHAELKDE